VSEFEGKVVIVAGGGGHVAKALAKSFAREGASVVGLDISDQALEGFTAAVAEVGGKSLAIACDLRDWTSLKNAVDRAAKEFGRIDILVNTATARTNPVWKDLEDCTLEEMTELMAVSPIGALGVMQAVLPYMKENGGKIINFGSGSGRNPALGLCPYGISKAAMHSLTKAAAAEWAKYKINVNGVLPFAMTPNMQKTLDEDPAKIEGFMPPLKWIGDPERDIGRVVLFLASSASDFVTGQNLPVDGGQDMML